MRRLAFVLLLAGCDAAEPMPAPDAGPLGVEEQFLAALRGQPDGEVTAVAAAMATQLDAGERAALGAIDFGDASGRDLLLATPFMKAWGACAAVLGPQFPRHGIEHPECGLVEDQTGGWGAAAGYTLGQELGATSPGEAHAPETVLFVSKKVAQGFGVTVELGFEFGNHCAGLLEEDGGTSCGAPGEPCCPPMLCEGGASCLGGVCIGG